MTRVMIVSVLTIGLLVTGCDTVKEELGLTRHTPDEFAVMQRAPLEIPADLNTLPKPNLGAPRPQEIPAKQQAQQAILGEVSTVADQESRSEKILLQKAGATAAQPDIRKQLELDAKVQSEDKRAVVKRLLNIGSDEKPASVVDAEAEAKRIQDAKKAGQSVTTGETPTVEQ